MCSQLYFSENVDDDYDYDVSSEDFTVPRFGGGVIDHATSQRSCNGALTLVHVQTSQDRSLELRSMKRSILRNRSGFPNLKRGFLRTNRKLIRVEATGNCCWRVHSLSNYRGKSEYIGPGYGGVPNLKVSSIKKVDCDFVKF